MYKKQFTDLYCYLAYDDITLDLDLGAREAEKRALEVLDERLGKDVIKHNIWVTLGPGNENLPSKREREFLLTDVGIDKRR